MAETAVLSEIWATRRHRAEALRERYPFVSEILTLYTALLDVQEQAFETARASPPDPSALPVYIADNVVSAVVEATRAHGPEQLSTLVSHRIAETDVGTIIRGWLAGAEQPAVDRYLARASTGPVLEAMGPTAGHVCLGPRDARHCPTCGGLPQVSYAAPSPEALVSAQRSLVCARCSTSWTYPRLTCANCGERENAHLTILAEQGTTEVEISGRVVRGTGETRETTAATARFPHLRIEACGTCSRYLIGVDLVRDPRAVPLVDELAAVPLDLYASDRGFSKIIPNVMGV